MRILTIATRFKTSYKMKMLAESKPSTTNSMLQTYWVSVAGLIWSIRFYMPTMQMIICTKQIMDE